MAKRFRSIEDDLWKDPGGNPVITTLWEQCLRRTFPQANMNVRFRWEMMKHARNKVIPETDQKGKARAVVTAGGLVFISGTDVKKLRVIDKLTGKLLWLTTLPAFAQCDRLHVPCQRNAVFRTFGWRDCWEFTWIFGYFSLH